MKEIIINVEGMVCGGCENRVINALKSVDGVSEVIADHKTGIVKVSAKDDIEEKWVVAPDGMMFSKDEIRQQIYFQEQYFDSEIVM